IPEVGQIAARDDWSRGFGRSLPIIRLKAPFRRWGRSPPATTGVEAS
mgnify:CR=1